MTEKELTEIVDMIKDCDNYLAGKQCSQNLNDIAKHAAKREVLLRRENLIDRFRDAGLRIEERV